MKKILSVLSLVFQLLPLAAESKSADIKIRGIALSLFEDARTLTLMDGERRVGDLQLQTDQLGARVSVSARAFAFGETADNGFRTFGKVVLPAEGKDFIIVFTPSEDGYKAFPVRADDPEFRGNDKHVFNFTTRRIEILLGTEKQTVAASENARLRPGFPEEATFYQAMFAYEEDGKFVPFRNSRWPVNPNTKALLFLFEDPSTGVIASRSVTELAK